MPGFLKDETSPASGELRGLMAMAGYHLMHPQQAEIINDTILSSKMLGTINTFVSCLATVQDKGLLVGGGRDGPPSLAEVAAAACYYTRSVFNGLCHSSAYQAVRMRAAIVQAGCLLEIGEPNHGLSCVTSANRNQNALVTKRSTLALTAEEAAKLQKLEEKVTETCQNTSSESSSDWLSRVDLSSIALRSTFNRNTFTEVVDLLDVRLKTLNVA
jgi:hypothetical protein